MPDPAIHELCCPTCGRSFDRNVYYEAAGVEFSMTMQPVQVVTARTPFLRCWNGHRWSIRTLTRAINQPDRVLLGDYLGEACDAP